ncbi:patatin-like phospholipase family protein [Flavobacterium sp. H122]|uniref:patatin-like phospholipase family protein n=1 Tax=Flavobacterium sp. H122 TaxID=2529860 RepID=UPI0010AA7119|nr:patatin-like phospholipase family protein [Flavobacterium sp. H122]
MTFKIGLCLAGAVSAGAYSAGVVDYLMEALHEWEKRKVSDPENTPNHQIEISAIGGASAGGITGLIMASMLDEDWSHVSKINNIKDNFSQNKLYNAWVDMEENNMMNKLLETEDHNACDSLLNSNFIDRLANKILTSDSKTELPRPFISNNVKVFVTLTNLRGMDFNIAFRSNAQKGENYIVTSHNDYACFNVSKSNESQYNNDGWIPLDFKNKLNVDLAKSAAMGTGAFPVFLKSRNFSRENKYLNDLDWFSTITRQAKNPFTEPVITTNNIDGGVINNEPFEYVRKILVEQTGQSDPKLYESFDTFESTIITIDPFPNGENQTSTGIRKANFINGIFDTLGALIDQARLKPSALITALDSNNASNYLIAPVRHDETGNRFEGDAAIACGALSGFSGFINKEFRVHDYFLGRANCEMFLREHFTVPFDTKNPIIKKGYENINLDNFITGEDEKFLPIIPIFTPKQEKMYMPQFSNNKNYPTISLSYVNELRKNIKKRSQFIIMKLAGDNFFQRTLLWIGAKVVLNNKIAETTVETIIKNLKEYQLLEKES